MIEITASKKNFLGLPTAEFLSDYWQKKPLLIRQAFPNYQAPLMPEDLAGLACEEAALSRLVTYHRKKDEWTLRTGPFAEQEFPTLGKKDWTLLVQDMDKWDADVRLLLNQFRFLPAWRVDDIMISFAVPGGSVGPHVDQYDVFLLQAQGRRHWQIDTDPSAPKTFRPDVELKLLQEFSPSHSWILEPGDMLYLPPNVPHHGEAIDACMTFSVGMRAPSSAELILDFAEELASHLPEESRYNDPGMAIVEDPFEIDEKAFTRLNQSLSALRNVDPAQQREWFGRFITRYRASGDVSPAPKTPSFATIEKALLAGGSLLRHPFTRMAWTRIEKSARLFVNGESFLMGINSAKCLAASEQLNQAQLNKLDAPGKLALTALLRSGHYHLQRTKSQKSHSKKSS